MKNFFFAATMALVAAPMFSNAQTISGPTKPQTAHVDYFLKIEGVDGESDAKDCNRCWIEVGSVQFKAPSATTLASGGGQSAGKASFSDLSFVAKNSTSSMNLAQAAATGEHIKKAVLFVRKAGKEQTSYLVIELENVLVTSYRVSPGSGSSIPTDSFSLNYTKIVFQTQGAAGKAKAVGAGQKPEAVLSHFVDKK